MSRNAFARLVLTVVTLSFALQASAVAPRRVLLVVAADSRESRELGRVVTELLGRLTVEVEVTRVERLDFAEIAHSAPGAAGSAPGKPPYLARLFVDLREQDHAVLWFLDPRHDRILVRQLDRSGSGSEELLREELGHILETSTEGLLAGAEIGLPRAEIIPTLGLPAPASRTPEPARVPKTEEHRFQIAALYEVEAFASPARVAHGPEASLFVRVSRSAPRVGVWLTGQYRWPMHVDASPVGARIEGGALRALLALDVPAHPRVTLRFALGAGTDLVALAPESSESGETSGVSLAESRLLAFAVVKAAVGVELRASPWLCVWGRLGVDLDPSGARYVFEKESGEDTVLRPWPVRPAFALGLGLP